MRWAIGLAEWMRVRARAVLQRRRVPLRAAPAPDDDAQAALRKSLEDLKDTVWELRESEARYRDLLDAQASVIARRDRNGQLTYVNQAFCRMFGCEPRSILGSRWQPVVLEEERAAIVEGARHRRTTQRLVTATGPRWIAFEFHPVPGSGSSGDAGEIQIVGTDITAEREMQTELATARDQAQAADRAKSRFLAAMSHEIRTPMNGILGMASLLDETTLTPEQRTYLDAIGQSARTLRIVIDEILDFSKIEAGRMVLANQPFAPHACVQSTVELLAPSAHEKGLDIAWTVDPRLPARVGGDEARFRQIMLNLIGNAVKFTDRGGVLVNVVCEAEGPDEVRLAIAVRDTGIGLSPDAQKGLFAEFGQADAGLSQRRGGTGLGLVISRRLAQAMGGDITVESEPGQGSVFTVHLTFEGLAGSGRALPQMLPPPRTGTVLLAFDRPVERSAVATSLTAAGLGVIECDASQAIAEIETAAASGEPVTAVVCDAGAPAEAAERILAQAREAARGRSIRGFLLIDTLSRPSLGRFRAAGFGAYLVRPVRPVALLSRFGLLPAAAWQDNAFDKPASPAPLLLDGVCGRHVLLAEDNPVNALLASRMLASAGCSVVHVSDGEQAVAAVARSLDQGQRRFHLVLMDVHMPRMDGLAATAAIRALADARALAAALPPIVALTANAFAEDRDRYLASGLDDYLAKPFEKRELMDLIARWDARADAGEAA
jgi:PAS domain S-box-containing protein